MSLKKRIKLQKTLVFPELYSQYFFLFYRYLLCSAYFLNVGKVAKMFSKIKDYTIEQSNDGIIDIFNGCDEKKFQLQNKNTIYSSRINKVMRFYE